jgi:hypothetical protein
MDKPQNFTTETDLEQNRNGTRWDLDLSKIKEKIGADRLENCNEELTAFLSNKDKSSNLTSSNNKRQIGFRSKRAKESLEQESSGFSSFPSDPFSVITTHRIECTLVQGDNQVNRL